MNLKILKSVLDQSLKIKVKNSLIFLFRKKKSSLNVSLVGFSKFVKLIKKQYIFLLFKGLSTKKLASSNGIIKNYNLKLGLDFTD